MKSLPLVIISVLLLAATRPVHGAAQPRKLDLPHSFGHFSSPGTTAQFLADERTLVFFDGKGITSWDFVARSAVSTIPARHWSFVVSPDGKLVAGNDDDGSSVVLYDAATGQTIHELKAPPSTARGPSPSQSMRFFRANGFDEKGIRLYTVNLQGIQTWDVQTGKIVSRAPTKKPAPNAPAQSRDGRWLTLDSGGIPQVLDTRTGKFSDIVSNSGPKRGGGGDYGLASWGSWSFADDGRTLYGVDQMNGLLAGWSLPDGKPLAAIRIPGLTGAEVSGDGTRILAIYVNESTNDAAGVIGVLRVLDAKTQRVIAKLGPFPLGAHAFSPSGRYVFTMAGKEPQLWDLTPTVRMEPATRPTPQASGPGNER